MPLMPSAVTEGTLYPFQENDLLSDHVRDVFLVFADAFHQFFVRKKIEAREIDAPRFVYALASSIVSCKLMCPKLVRRKRSVVCNDSVWGCPPSSSHPRSLKPVVSTTSVSLSHLPTA